MQPESIHQELRRMQEKIDRLERNEAKNGARKKPSVIGRIAVTAALFLIPVVAFGVTITKPYTFVSGQPISASELNANFDTVYDRVNELGVLKVKAGTTVLGTFAGTLNGKSAANFITDEGYLSGVAEVSSTQKLISFQSVNFTKFYASATCSGNPIVPRANKNIVFYDTALAQHMYSTNSHPASVPGYVSFYGMCNPNAQAGTQVAADFWTTAANDETITGVPNSVSGDVTISME